MKKIWFYILVMIMLATKVSAIDLIVPASAGGTYHKFANIIADDLKDKGHEVKIVVSGNCVIGKKIWEQSETAIMINSEATNSIEKCHVPIRKENFAVNLLTAGWVIVSKTNSLGEKMGVVGYMKDIFKDFDVKLVPYKNTTEVKAAFLVGEIDSAFLTTGRASEIEDKIELLNTQDKNKGKFKKWKNNDLTLNYYLTQKNVDVKVIDIIKNNKTLIAIASKKNMIPVTYKSVNRQIKYLKRNEKKWK